MKKFLALILAFCMIISLVGCGGKKVLKVSDLFSSNDLNILYYLSDGRAGDSVKYSDSISFVLACQNNNITYYKIPSGLHIEDIDSMDDNEVISYIETLASEKKEISVEFLIEKDSSGNNVKLEALRFSEDLFTGITWQPNNNIFQIDNIDGPNTVLSKQFIGLVENHNNYQEQLAFRINDGDETTIVYNDATDNNVIDGK